jgi:hypothetical protein
MFDERIPSELRLLLMGAFAAHRRLATALSWISAAAAVPEEFDVVVRAQLQRMEENTWALVARYRQGELTREEVESKLEADFDWDRTPSPELEALLAKAAPQ